MELSPFSLKNKKIFERSLQAGLHELSGYSFVNAFIWRCLYDIRWNNEFGSFCLFFKDRAGCFMPLPPLGGLDAALVDECFKAMDAANRNPEFSRVENIEKHDIGFFEKRGFAVYEKSCDYVVRRDAIASLKGERLKHRRNLYNYFTKHHKVLFRDYQPEDRGSVEALFGRWKTERLARPHDSFYGGMLNDNQKAFQELLSCLVSSGAVAKVAVVGEKIAAFTSGVLISKGMFCVNYEIADHGYKGLAQYIFTQLARSLDTEEINMMDDSGLESLKKTKMLFGDVRRVLSFTAIRKR
jgi:hypothetical protein